MITVPVKRKCFDGQVHEFQKLAIFAELDTKGNIFIKVEGHNSSNISAVYFDYDLDHALEEFKKMAAAFLGEQIEQLRGYDVG